MLPPVLLANPVAYHLLTSHYQLLLSCLPAASQLLTSCLPVTYQLRVTYQVFLMQLLSVLQLPALLLDQRLWCFSITSLKILRESSCMGADMFPAAVSTRQCPKQSDMIVTSAIQILGCPIRLSVKQSLLVHSLHCCGGPVQVCSCPVSRLLWLFADTTQQYAEGFHSEPNLAVAPYPGRYYLFIAMQIGVCAPGLLHFSVR